ncbi:class I SAM-dependent methyltransferase [Microbaculum marinum]|uniref:Class I SAM-dependent methyltransferase n=1 Tax=Microbaculum marinum TaxID=1764581 RepID=A0AAW9RWT8_9HYPH
MSTGRGGGRLAWFDELYRDAGEDAGNVPWSRSGPHPGLAHWAASAPEHGGSAIDVGCGLGDNAEYLAELGYETTAFDLSETAIAWARRRFPRSPVAYAVADLFDLPTAWIGAFHFVDEIYTLQALPEDMRQNALANIAKLAAPGGRILVVCIASDDAGRTDGPPWPLARSEIDGFLRHGFGTESFQDLVLGENDRRHFVATYRRL